MRVGPAAALTLSGCSEAFVRSPSPKAGGSQQRKRRADPAGVQTPDVLC